MGKADWLALADGSVHRLLRSSTRFPFGSQIPMRLSHIVTLLALAAPASLPAQAPEPYQFTIEDYARAERFLAPTATRW